MGLPRVSLVAAAAFLLVQAHAPGRAESLATLYGRTLGEASECKAIARARIDRAATLASAHIKSLAATPAERMAAGNSLAKGVDRGSRDVTSGAITCRQAESELDALEHELAASR